MLRARGRLCARPRQAALLPAPLATTPRVPGCATNCPVGSAEIRQVKGRPSTANKQSDEETSTTQSPKAPFHPLPSGRFRPGQSLPRACSGPAGGCTPGPTCCCHTWEHSPPRGPGVPGLTQPWGRGSPTHAPCSSGAGRPPPPSWPPSWLLSAHRIALPNPPARQSWRLSTQIGGWAWAGGFGWILVSSPWCLHGSPAPPGEAQGFLGAAGRGLGHGFCWVGGGRVERPHHQWP